MPPENRPDLGRAPARIECKYFRPLVQASRSWAQSSPQDSYEAALELPGVTGEGAKAASQIERGTSGCHLRGRTGWKRLMV